MQVTCRGSDQDKQEQSSSHLQHGARDCLTVQMLIVELVVEHRVEVQPSRRHARRGAEEVKIARGPYAFEDTGKPLLC